VAWFATTLTHIAANPTKTIAVQ